MTEEKKEIIKELVSLFLVAVELVMLASAVLAIFINQPLYAVYFMLVAIYLSKGLRDD